MRNRTWYRLSLVLLAFSLLATACGDDGDDNSGGGDDDVASDSGDSGDSDDSGSEEEAMASLADVCPSPLVIQTDWFPESEHAALYNLIGDGYSVDSDNKLVSGPMVSGGSDLGIELEVRAGGPAIGFSPVAAHMYTDASVHIGYGSTDGQILRHADTPMLSVMAPLEKNPQMIMWDPAAYPNVETLADLGTEGVTINIFGGGTFADVFVAQGIWSADQVDPSYDGSPARFVSEGDIAQQGFASSEPHLYENVIEEWSKPVRYQLLHDTGFDIYSQTLAIRPDDKADLDACLTLVVPIIQQSTVDYAASPAHANAVIIDTVEQFADWWVYDAARAEFAHATMVETGLISNGPDGTVGNMDPDRVQGLIDQLVEAGMDVPSGLTAADIMTNEYIDDSIGLAGGDSGSDEEAVVSLADVCPSPLVIQTDWFPESEHAALYNLIGDGYSVDSDNKLVSGPMVSGGSDLGIELEVRAGGPAIGFSPVAAHMYTDASVHIGYGSTDGQILRHADTPMLSVMAPLEKNPQMIMWDPAAYPNVETLADLGTEGVTINIFGGGTFADVFVAQGIWSADQVDPSYDGSPARFVSEGDIAQQGFASSEPHLYENVIEEWSKPVRYQLLHDTGFDIYSQTLAIRPDDKADLDACLTLVVPIIQQSTVDYAASPAHANAVIIDTVEQFADWWVYDAARAEFAHATMVETGLISNGPDGTVGNMDPDRVQGLIDQLVEAGMDVPSGLTAADIMTNEYIDDSIGL